MAVVVGPDSSVLLDRAVLSPSLDDPALCY